MFQLFKVFKMIRSTKKIMVSSENFDFEFSAFLKADPKIAEFDHICYFVVVLSDISTLLRSYMNLLTRILPKILVMSQSNHAFAFSLRVCRERQNLFNGETRSLMRSQNIQVLKRMNTFEKNNGF